MRASIRAVVAALVVAATTFLVSGCAVVPLLDGRSPFDSPFNPSYAQIRTMLPLVQSAVDEVGSAHPAWKVTASGSAHDCEGPCNLHVQVTIVVADASSLTPIDASSLRYDAPPTYAVPEEVLRDTVLAAIPVAEKLKVDVEFSSGSELLAPQGSPRANMSAAVAALFAAQLKGNDYHYGNDYSVLVGENSNGSVAAYTRAHSDVLASMRLR